ncbi:rabankyrin-5-like isoform X2 [Pomacea canaliculata]|uniref:rabankyrin-5-like isoform X2 n=1 Tax=Pomacea canaliculata TaxID=400727 RepID=UPI000D728C19|nr:rabankyrin-5-like isoform X2 [Pomacea canaliculata]
MADEVVKLQNHLSLLREEYVKLQNRYADLERRYHMAIAASGDGDNDGSFVTRLLRIISEMYNKEQYSDLRVLLEGGHQVHAHKFVLQARSEDWAATCDLGHASELDMSDVRLEVARALLRWVYTDEINIQAEDTFLLELLRAATRFKLEALRKRCENGLVSFVNMKNCIQFYQTAEEMSAEVLKKHCSELISNHWNEFTSEDFKTMPAPLLYGIFKTKTEYPLHAAIKAHREDVVFLYLIEYDSQLQARVNEVDNKGDIPLDMALQSMQKSIAQTLVKNHADINRKDNSGKCLLHKAIKRGDEFSARFLISNKADVNTTTFLDKETPLHMVACFNPDVTPPSTLAGMADVARLLLEAGADPNVQDASGSTPLHNAIFCKNGPVVKVLLEFGDLNLEMKNADGHTPLWLALQQVNDSHASAEEAYGHNSFAQQLIRAGSSPDAVEPESGNSLLHLASKSGNQAAGIFLAEHGATVNHANTKGETPLHFACEAGLTELVKILLERGANSNSQTLKSSASSLDTELDFLGLGGEGAQPISKQTPLHLALAKAHNSVVQVFLQYKAQVQKSPDNMRIMPNFNLKDSQGQTVLGLALWQGLHETAAAFLNAGANINERNAAGLTLLHEAIEKQDTISALFLIEHHADLEAESPEKLRPLQRAIARHLPVIVETLCGRGANMNIMDGDGNCPLWQALDTGQEDIAQILVYHKCDVNLWSPGPGNCQQTLLHRAIDENNEAVACFLIRSHCDLNSPRRPGTNGSVSEEARDGQSPLHLACSWGLELVVQCLMEHNANVNQQDAEGKTPIHLAIENQHPVIISLLLSHPSLNLTLKDKHGSTPFVAAMMTRNNKAAQAILDREPTAAEQVDQRGRNFLHTAIQKTDIESVLFLISVHANVNSRTQDAHHLSPLHLAVMAGSEIIVRNLLLAGASVNEKTKTGETALHLAAARDHTLIVSILVENGADVDAVDENHNNALHVAVQHGNLSTVKALLTESHINAEAVNLKGQNPLHLLGQYGKDNAAAMFELFREAIPDYPIDRPDAEGNTALLLAYVNGNGSLCRVMVRAGACLGTVNKQGVGIFNAPVATKQLLFKLLDMLSKEPPWSEGEWCLECSTKFTIKTRKHHCRHCGRLLCSKCSGKDMPIIKFGLAKPVRVCDVCFDVLSIGGQF